MLGTIIGGLIVGGAVMHCVNSYRERHSKNESSSSSSCGSYSYTISYPSLPQASTRSKYDKQVDFFDNFRELDNTLSRKVGEGFKGVTYLINGMYATKYNDKDVRYALKNIRNYRSMLTHDKRKWADIPAPSDSLVRDMRIASRWVKEHPDTAARLVYEGRKYLLNRCPKG